MEQNIQPSDNPVEIKLDNEGESITPRFKKKINKKVILLIIIILLIIGAGAVYFLFLNKEDDSQLLPEENAEVEVDKELDSDQDGLPDYMEEILGTNANNTDTDGDSYSDFEEIKNGYNPLNDEKYIEGEWGVVKEMIKNGDEVLFEEMFNLITNSNGNGSEVANENFSSPEETLKMYILAIETKDLNLYLKAYDKESIGILTQQDSAFAGSINISKWNPMLSTMFKKANYEISEQTDKYAIMSPKYREQTSSTSSDIPVELELMSDVYFSYEDSLWKINFITTLSDLVMRTPEEESMLSLDEKKEEIEQIKEDWRDSFK